jgi:TolB-like protein/Tfp pilus assembly protein PilF/class 3 adenylate cyclase
MGEIYLAHDANLLRQVALKILPASFTQNEDLLRRFKQEATAISTLNHPNIITIHEIGQTDGVHFIATEFIDGVTLRQYLAERPRVNLDEVLDIMIQATAALTVAHAAGIVHRDIKPENIMVRKDGYVKVLDFGLAKLTRPNVIGRFKPEDTDPNVIMGTIAYMSPEHARGYAVDARADIWSVGAVLYELLAGRKPFEGDTQSDLLVSILSKEPLPLGQFLREVPEQLNAIIERALVKDREQRYSNIAELVTDLKRLQRHLEFGTMLERATLPQIHINIGEDAQAGLASVGQPDGPPTAAETASKFEADVMPFDLNEQLELDMAHVLFMDIVGYSKMSLGAQARVLKKLQNIVRATEQFRRAQEKDQLIRLPTGDGMALVFFRKSAAPVQCAVEVARALLQAPEIKLRMGVHSGYVCAMEDINGKVNVAGDGINYAQRVMDCGDTGHILVSKVVADALSQIGEWGESLRDLGSAEVKHGVLVHIYNVCTSEIGNRARPSKLAVSGQTGSVKTSGRLKRNKPIDSVAVLPLVNAGKDESSEYLSDGITESIINSLSQIPSFKVMARSTVFRYKGKDVDPQSVGAELNVGAVLTGRIQQLGDSLIIKTELVNVADGSQLWGAQYNRRSSDVLAMQEEISQEISEKLRVKLTRAEKKKIGKSHTTDSKAYELYLKGRYCLSRMTEDDLREAIKNFQRAIKSDPRYSLAYAGLADAYYGLSSAHVPAKEAMPRAKAAAEKALELDETLAEGHVSLGLVKVYYDWDWEGAEKQYRRAIELKPGYAWAHQCYGWYLTLMKRNQEAAAELNKAFELDPLSPETSADLGMPFLFARQYDQAIECWQKALRIDDNYIWAQFYIGWAYEGKGEVARAIEILRETNEGFDIPLISAGLAHAYAISGKKEEANRILEKLKEQSKRRHVSPYHFAIVHAGLGNADQAIEQLEKAFEDKSESVVWLDADPRLDCLRSDQRFNNLLSQCWPGVAKQCAGIELG